MPDNLADSSNPLLHIFLEIPICFGYMHKMLVDFGDAKLTGLFRRFLSYEIFKFDRCLY